MSTGGWQDAIISERLEVDRSFQGRIQESSLSNQSWELVMTAVELEVDTSSPDGEARLVANTQMLDSVLPAIADVESRQGGPPSGGGGGVLARIRDSLGFGNGGGSKYRNEAETLAQSYADELQQTLEDRGRWETVVERATSEHESD